MLVEIENITAEENELLKRLADINYAPLVSGFVDTSECDLEEQLTAGDGVNGLIGDAAAGGQWEKLLEDGPEKVKDDKPGLANAMPSTVRSTEATNQPSEQSQRENHTSNTETADKPVSSSQTEKNRPWQVKVKNCLKL